MLDRQQVCELLGSEFYKGGFIDRRAGSVQPLSYCRGLAQNAINKGARFYGYTPGLRIEQNANSHRIISNNGAINAKSVLICTNGYTNLVPNDPLIKKLSQSVIPLYSYKVATKPLSDEFRSTIIPGEQVIADTRRLLTYFRKDHMGRLVMGGAGGPYEANSEKDYRSIVKRISEIYPQLGRPEIEFRWCGKVCITLDGVPHVHELAPRVYTGLGYNGRGVAMASLMGKWLAAMVCQNEMDTDTIPITSPQSIPFHGIRNPFVKAAHYVKNFQDILER